MTTSQRKLRSPIWNASSRANSTSQGGSELVVMDEPSEYSTSTERKMASVASVTMIDGSLKRATRKPLMAPKPMPNAMAISGTSGAGMPG